MAALDIARLEATTMGDREFESMLIHTFLTQYQDRVAALHTLLVEDEVEFIRAVHQLAGASASLGAVRLGGIAAGLERSIKAGLTGVVLVRLTGELQQEFGRVWRELSARLPSGVNACAG